MQPSHVGDTFEPNPKYRLKNDRNYGKGENQEKVIVNSTEEKFDPSYHITDNPDATNGPIVIDSEGNALGGNGRAMILQRVFKGSGEAAGKYRGLLEAKLQQFGINPETVKGMKQPVLVRVIDDAEFSKPNSSKARAITDFNKKGTAELTPAERAIADSRGVSPATLEKVSARLEKIGPNATLAEALEGRHGTELLQQLIDDGVISHQERAAFQSGEQLTKAGKDRIHSLMLGRFFADPAQLDSIPAAIRNKIERVAAPLAQVEGKHGWNLSPHMQEAVNVLEGARAAGANVSDYLKQSSLFGEAKFDAKAVTLARALEAMKPTEFAAKLKQYAQDAVYAENGATMFGEPPTPESAFRDAFEAQQPAQLPKAVGAPAATPAPVKLGDVGKPPAAKAAPAAKPAPAADPSKLDWATERFVRSNTPAELRKFIADANKVKERMRSEGRTVWDIEARDNDIATYQKALDYLEKYGKPR